MEVCIFFLLFPFLMEWWFDVMDLIKTLSKPKPLVGEKSTEPSIVQCYLYTRKYTEWFKAALINIPTLTIDQMTMCDV